MDIQTALVTRRTIHKYAPDPLPDGALKRALDAAHHAPNHKMTIPWRFAELGPESREQLTQLNIRLRTPEGSDPDPGLVKAIRTKRGNPATLLLVTRVLHEDPILAREDYAACACAIQNLCLSLHAEGVGTKWSTGKLVRHPDAYSILQVDEQQEEIIGYVWCGIPEKCPSPKRPDVETVVRSLP